MAMSGTEARHGQTKDPVELAREWAGLAEQSSRLVQAFASRQGGSHAFSIVDPASVFAAFASAASRLAADPAQLMQAQMQFWQDSMRLWDYAMRRATGERLGNPAADQALGPFLAPVEQNMPSMVAVCVAVASSGYAALFEEVWGE